MTELDFRPIVDDEYADFYRCFELTFGDEPHETDMERFALIFEPKRSIAGFDGRQLISTAGAFSFSMTVPGGQRPVAGVTVVSVQPTHRRRGVLTEMMRRQLTGLYEEGAEAVAALWASEATIYGRFGYGIASRRLVISGDTQRLALRPDVDTGGGRIRVIGVDEAAPLLQALYDGVWQDRVGWFARSEAWWEAERLPDPEHWRDGAGRLRFAVHERADGSVGGYATYRIKTGSQGPRPANEVLIRELVAADPASYAAVWSFLFSHDLTAWVRSRMSPLDDPLPHLVTDARALSTEVLDNIWVRLADVGRALAERTYTTELDVVLEVADPFCPWNAGRWRLAAGPDGATCARTSDPADLELTSTELGAAYLGGTTLRTLADAGRVRELRSGALAAASRAFAGERAPFCPEVF